MWPHPLWFISLYFLAAVFNLAIGLMLGYFRFKGGTDNYTKSQLWALSILTFLFIMNFFILFREFYFFITDNQGIAWTGWWLWFIWSDSVLFTSALLLAFGLIYPRPVMTWKRLRWVIFGVLGLGLVVVFFESYYQHNTYYVLLEVDRIYFFYLFAIFIPVFIWLGEYSRQPSRESRMIYTILIWGFLFLYYSSHTNVILHYTYYEIPLYMYHLLYIVLLVLVLIRLSHALWMNRKRWSTPETLHIVMLALAIGLGLMTKVIEINTHTNPLQENIRQVQLLFLFLNYNAGWMILRPILFTYGLLRFRLLGSQVKPERALAIVIAVTSSTLVGLLVMNLLWSFLGPVSIVPAVVLGLVLVLPSWRISERFVSKNVVKLENVETMSMRRRRNIYLMGLQTAVFKGKIDDERDREALQNLKEELGITDREHELLLESISLHEARRMPEKDVEEVYIIHKHGLLVSRYKKVSTEEEEDDSDIFAGMFTALTEFVQETMKKGEEGASTTDAIDYGPATMAIERDQNIVMASLITGADDLELRQLMRDTLAEINQTWGDVLTTEWDGDLDAVKGIEKVLRDFVSRVKRRA